MLRIHFTGEDLARTVFAEEPDPMWEMLISLNRLRRGDSSVLFGAWRRQALARVPPSTRLLTALAPVTGYAVDFLNAAFGRGLDEQTEALRAVPRERVLKDLETFNRLNPGRRLPPWAAELADGRSRMPGRLADAAVDYIDSCVAPYWQHIQGQVSRERAQRSTLLARGGWSAVFATLHPSARWHHPVLELDYSTDQDLHLEGRGLVLQPSVFCRNRVTGFADPDLPPVLVYPIEPELGWADPEQRAGQHRSVARLIGKARADLLSATADGPATTSELARRVRVTPSTASRHLTALREAGLVSRRRYRNATLHTITPMGVALLDGRLPKLLHTHGRQREDTAWTSRSSGNGSRT
ncbi:winged helix-turn-helix domain-containing protein [Streptomyces sp. NPDC049577]|uniref:ArsR/SmtB family transcription factor n=1 Tax=Streptomyces sp. NPDC049577 TaxID=3155153 RepID=UPI0034413EF8